jgi:outer membrane protein OmpA-like peptidoglycan-associated protein
MKLASLSESSVIPHPLLLRWLTFIMIGAIMLIPLLFMAILSPFGSQNRMYSRVFYLSPDLHNSKSKIRNLNLSGYTVSVLPPIDNRHSFYGESFHNGTKVEPVGDFFYRPVMQEIQSKIEYDLARFGSNMQYDSKRRLGIKTSVDVFYPDVKGYGWLKAYAKVRLKMTATLNDSTIIDKKYQSTYSSSGLDKDYEGSIITTIEQATNVTLGITLRKTLDQFYSDLINALPTHIQMRNVLFGVGSSELPEESKPNLRAVIDYMKANPRSKIELDGYTDTLGDFAKDEELSLDRVNTVKSYLVHHGIRSRRIKTNALGATKPISTDNGEEFRKLNRRVEFVIIKS